MVATEKLRRSFKATKARESCHFTCHVNRSTLALTIHDGKLAQFLFYCLPLFNGSFKSTIFRL